MKAIRVNSFGDPGVMTLETVPDPVAGAGEVIVLVKAAGVNPVDTYIRSGNYARKPELPYTPGSDGAGIVEAVGDGVVHVEVGDRVYTSGSITGTYAERVRCRAEQVHPLPAEASFQQGAAVGVPYATAYRALIQRADAQAGDVVLVHGASGGVGTAAVQLARREGMTVIGTGGSDEGRDLAALQGADYVLDHHAPEHLDEVMKVTDGRGVDVILEMLANVNLADDLKVLAPRGRVVVIGSRGAVEVNPRDAMAKDAAILGMLLYNATEEEHRRIHAGLQAGLADGTLQPVIGTEIPLSDAPLAHEKVMSAGANGNVVLVL